MFCYRCSKPPNNDKEKIPSACKYNSFNWNLCIVRDNFFLDNENKKVKSLIFLKSSPFKAKRTEISLTFIKSDTCGSDHQNGHHPRFFF